MTWFFKTISSATKISFKNLTVSKLRSFLTILGIVIGVASVIVIFSAGRSAQDLILDQIKGVGSNLIAVLPGASDEEGPPAAAFGIAQTTLLYDDLEALRDKRRVPEVEAGAGYVLGTAVVSSSLEDKTLSFTGTTASYIDVENANIGEGRFFSKEEERNMARVAVLGNKAAEDLFPGRDPLNERIEIKDQNFTVVGVFEPRGTTAFGVASQDESVIVPLRSAQDLLLGIDYLGAVRLKVTEADLIQSAKANIKATMREQHDITDPVNDDFSVRDLAAALDVITRLTDVLRYFLLAIGTVSLVVGGVGIMNIMLIAVNQRIREIGVRRAVGAKSIDVKVQFIIESATVSFIGGIVGIVLGVLVSYLAAIVIQSLGYNWKFLLSPTSIIAATLISVLIGVIFGLYPARKASQVSPMEALRYE